jgi:pimeloyl-ACP methyl ester carboxylesterase
VTYAASLEHVAAGALFVAYARSGPPDGWPVVLLHGFPYDIAAYDGVVPLLTARGARTYVPYLRGFGQTRFLSARTLRSGQQAALGNDLREFLDALHLESATLAGYDWGGRAACVVAALMPQRVRGLVSVNGYNIQDIARAGEPATPENERRLWYQYYFHGARGRAGLESDRRALCRLLWELWSPNWRFDAATFERTAASFENPDFVEVVIHSYRHRFGLVPGAPELEEMERRLAALPPIAVPAITLDGEADGVMAIGGTAAHAAHFTGRHEHRSVPAAGHNLPAEDARAFADAVLTVASWGSESARSIR